MHYFSGSCTLFQSKVLQNALFDTKMKLWLHASYKTFFCVTLRQEHGEGFGRMFYFGGRKHVEYMGETR